MPLDCGKNGAGMKRRNIALIPAAGIGSRFGAGKPKQYVEIGAKPFCNTLWTSSSTIP